MLALAECTADDTLDLLEDRLADEIHMAKLCQACADARDKTDA